MATTVTKRVSGAITESITKRTPFDGGDASIYDAWGNSWGTPGDSSWGSAWLVFLSLSQIGHTARVSSPPSANITKRVTGV
jgi:hypothetical protein